MLQQKPQRDYRLSASELLEDEEEPLLLLELDPLSLPLLELPLPDSASAKESSVQ